MSIKSKFDSLGREIMDKVKMAIPVRMKRPPTLQEEMARLLRNPAFMGDLRSNGVETIDEADDFDVDEEGEFQSQHELVHDEDLQKEIPKGEKAFLDRNRQIFDAHVRAERRRPKTPPPADPAPPKAHRAKGAADDDAED